VSEAIGAMAAATQRTALNAPPDLEEVFSRFVDPVYRFLYSHVGNREDAEDLTSEVFLKAARQLDSERPEASIAKWLFTVARTVLADHWRRYYRGGGHVPLDDTYLGTARQDPAPRMSAARASLLDELLDSLPERYRMVLELRFLRGYSIQETARELDTTPENAKVIQHRALAKAAQLMEGRL